jgi:hypothetical protein
MFPAEPFLSQLNQFDNLSYFPKFGLIFFSRLYPGLLERSLHWSLVGKTALEAFMNQKPTTDKG